MSSSRERMILKKRRDEEERQKKVFESRTEFLRKDAEGRLSPEEESKKKTEELLLAVNVIATLASIPAGVGLLRSGVSLGAKGVGALISSVGAKQALKVGASQAVKTGLKTGLKTGAKQAVKTGLTNEVLLADSLKVLSETEKGTALLNQELNAYRVSQGLPVVEDVFTVTKNLNKPVFKEAAKEAIFKPKNVLFEGSAVVKEIPLGIDVGNGITLLEESAEVLNNVIIPEAFDNVANVSSVLNSGSKVVASVGAGLAVGTAVSEISNRIGSEDVIDQRTELENELDSIGINRDGLGSDEVEIILNRLDIDDVQEILGSFDSTQPEVFNKIMDSEIGSYDPYLKGSELIAVDPTGRIIGSQEFKISNFNFIDPYHMGLDFGIELGHQIPYISKLNNNGMSRTRSLLLSSILSTSGSPREAWISKKLNTFLLSSEYIENPDLYLNKYSAVNVVYDGSFGSEAFMSEDEKVSIYDETGELIKYTGSQGTINIGSKSYDNPSTVGVWIGPASTNNRLPESVGTGSNNFLDTLAFLHDQGYEENGYFSSYDDMKLVSRIRSNMDKFTGSDYYLAIFVANWFDVVGPLLSKITSQESSDQKFGSLLYADSDDLFSYIFGPFLSQNINNINAVRAQRLIRSNSRSRFYAGLRSGLDIAYKQEVSNIGYPLDINSNSLIIDNFKNIPIKFN